MRTTILAYFDNKVIGAIEEYDGRFYAFDKNDDEIDPRLPMGETSDYIDFPTFDAAENEVRNQG